MGSFIEKNFPTFAKTSGTSNQQGKKGRGKSKAEGGLPKGYKPTTPMLPEVNLLPAHYVYRIEKRNIIFRTIIVAMVIVGVSFIGYGVLRTQATLSNTELATAKNNLASAQTQLQQLQPVQAMLDTLKKRAEQEGKLLGPKVRYGQALTAAAISLPPGARYDGLGVTPNFSDPSDQNATKAFTDSCAPPLDPFETIVTVPVTACISYTGTFATTGVAPLKQLEANLKRKPVFDNVSVKPAEGTAAPAETAPTTPTAPSTTTTTPQNKGFDGSAWVIDTTQTLEK